MFNLPQKSSTSIQDSQFSILKKRYKIIQSIGSGSFGKVYKAEDIEENREVAIKQIPKSVLQGNDYLFKAFWKELQIMKLCECEHSVYLYDHFEENNAYNIIMELCDTDLEEVLSKRENGFSEKELQVILTQLNVVFDKMNKENIIHRDLKLKNVLVKYDIRIPVIGFSTKLSDFGFSKVMDDDITRTKLGTPATMAPEILLNQSYDKKADLWSLGVISYQLLFKKLPFSARDERGLLRTILNSKGIVIPQDKKDSVSESLQNLLQSLLQVKPSNRINFDQYFNHPFFNGNKSELFIVPEDKFVAIEENQTPFEDRFESVAKISEYFMEYSIYKAKDNLTGKDVFFKEILKKTVDENSVYKKVFEKEIDLMKTLKGDCFIQFVDLYITSTHYIIVTEIFKGKILDNYLKENKSLSEKFIQKIIHQLIPAFKELSNKGIILDFISTKSFYFSYFESEENFKIKFFDYGLSGIFTSDDGRKEYLLNETRFGTTSLQKTNILSFGLVLYKLLFNESLSKFYLEQGNNNNQENEKIIKIPKQISKKCRNFLENILTLQTEKRYSWNEMINDPFITVEVEKDNSKGKIQDKNKIEDKIVINISSYLLTKIKSIISYYNELITEREIDFQQYHKFYNEMTICSILSMFEIKLFSEFIKNKENFLEDEEIHFLKIDTSSTQIKYQYSYINCIHDNISINTQNEELKFVRLELYTKEKELQKIISTLSKTVGMNMENMDSMDFFNKSEKTGFNGNLDRYFIKLFENGFLCYSKKEYEKAKQEFLMSQYCLEFIVLIRMISSYKRETNYYSEFIKKLENISSKENENIIISFIGGIIKTFKSQKILVENDPNTSNLNSNDNSSAQTNSNSNSLNSSVQVYETLITFYPDVIKMIKDCEIKIQEIH